MPIIIRGPSYSASPSGMYSSSSSNISPTTNGRAINNNTPGRITVGIQQKYRRNRLPTIVEEKHRRPPRQPSSTAIVHSSVAANISRHSTTSTNNNTGGINLLPSEPSRQQQQLKLRSGAIHKQQQQQPNPPPTPSPANSSVADTRRRPTTNVNNRGGINTSTSGKGHPQKQQHKPSTFPPGSAYTSVIHHQSKMMDHHSRGAIISKPTDGDMKKFIDGMANLPLYNQEGDLLQKYGHDRHVSTRNDWRYAPPKHYMPPPSYWQHHARAIRCNVFTEEFISSINRTFIGYNIDDGFGLTRHPVADAFGADANFPAIRKLIVHIQKGARDYMATNNCNWCYNHNVFTSLPSTHSQYHARTILYSALIIEMCQFTYGQPLASAHNILRMVYTFLYLLIPHPSCASVFTVTAAESAFRALHVTARTSKKQMHKQRARMLEFEKEKLLRIDRDSRVSKWLWYQQAKKDHFASKIQRWYLRQQLKRTITHRIIQRTITNNIRANLQSLCIGASIYANNIKASRPPRDSSISSTTAPTQPKPNSPTHAHPFRHRGLPLNNNQKRRQTNRRRDRRIRQKKSRNRPPRKFRTGSSSSSTPLLNHLPTNHLDSIDQATDAHQTHSTTTTIASNDSSVPSIDESDSPLSSKGESVRHSTNNDQPVILPMWFWAAQTSAAIIKLGISTTESVIKPPPTPAKAASTIQRLYRQYHTQRLAKAASTLQKWFRSHQYNPSHSTTDFWILSESWPQGHPSYNRHYLLGLLHYYDTKQYDIDRTFTDELGITATNRQRRVLCYRFCWGSRTLSSYLDCYSRTIPSYIDYINTNTTITPSTPSENDYNNNDVIIIDDTPDDITNNTPTLTARLGISLDIICTTVKKELHYKFWS